MIKPQTPTDNKPETITVHTATGADAAAIAQLAQELADYERSVSLCSEAAVRRLIETGIEPKCRVYVAKNVINTIGFVVFYPGYDLSSDSYGFHIADICVTAAERRKGCGKLLFSAVASKAHAENRQWVSLTVLGNNREAQKFYKKLGLIQTGASLWATGKNGIVLNVNPSLI